MHRRQEQSEVTDHDGGIQGRTQVQTLHARVIILGPIRRIVMPACQHSYMVGQASSSHSGLVGGEALSMHVTPALLWEAVRRLTVRGEAPVFVGTIREMVHACLPIDTLLSATPTCSKTFTYSHGGPTA